MHQQEVSGILTLPFHLGNTGSHRHSGYTRRTNKGIDFSTTEFIHYLAHQDTTGSTKGKGENAQAHNFNGFEIEEGFRIGSGAHRNTKENNNDVHQLILGSLTQAVHHK